MSGKDFIVESLYKITGIIENLKIVDINTGEIIKEWPTLKNTETFWAKQNASLSSNYILFDFITKNPIDVFGMPLSKVAKTAVYYRSQIGGLLPADNNNFSKSGTTFSKNFTYTNTSGSSITIYGLMSYYGDEYHNRKYEQVFTYFSFEDDIIILPNNTMISGRYVIHYDRNQSGDIGNDNYSTSTIQTNGLQGYIFNGISAGLREYKYTRIFVKKSQYLGVNTSDIPESIVDVTASSSHPEKKVFDNSSMVGEIYYKFLSDGQVGTCNARREMGMGNGLSAWRWYADRYNSNYDMNPVCEYGVSYLDSYRYHRDYNDQDRWYYYRGPEREIYPYKIIFPQKKGSIWEHRSSGYHEMPFACLISMLNDYTKRSNTQAHHVMYLYWDEQPTFSVFFKWAYRDSSDNANFEVKLFINGQEFTPVNIERQDDTYYYADFDLSSLPSSGEGIVVIYIHRTAGRWCPFNSLGSFLFLCPYTNMYGYAIPNVCLFYEDSSDITSNWLCSSYAHIGGEDTDIQNYVSDINNYNALDLVQNTPISYISSKEGAYWVWVKESEKDKLAGVLEPDKYHCIYKSIRSRRLVAPYPAVHKTFIWNRNFNYWSCSYSQIQNSTNLMLYEGVHLDTENRIFNMETEAVADISYIFSPKIYFARKQGETAFNYRLSSAQVDYQEGTPIVEYNGNTYEIEVAIQENEQIGNLNVTFNTNSVMKQGEYISIPVADCESVIPVDSLEKWHREYFNYRPFSDNDILEWGSNVGTDEIIYEQRFDDNYSYNYNVYKHLLNKEEQILYYPETDYTFTDFKFSNKLNRVFVFNLSPQIFSNYDCGVDVYKSNKYQPIILIPKIVKENGKTYYTNIETLFITDGIHDIGWSLLNKETDSNLINDDLNIEEHLNNWLISINLEDLSSINDRIGNNGSIIFFCYIETKEKDNFLPKEYNINYNYIFENYFENPLIDILNDNSCILFAPFISSKFDITNNNLVVFASRNVKIESNSNFNYLKALDNHSVINYYNTNWEKFFNYNYKPSSSGYTSWQYNEFNAFDGNSSTLWGISELPCWIMYDFGEGNAQRIVKYKIYETNTISGWDSYNYCPKDWTFEGSNDGTNWTVLDNRTDVVWTSDGWKEFIFSNSEAYRYYRLNITANNDSGNSNNVMIGNIELVDNGDVVQSNIINEYDWAFSFFVDVNSDTYIKYEYESFYVEITGTTINIVSNDATYSTTLNEGWQLIALTYKNAYLTVYSNENIVLEGFIRISETQYTPIYQYFMVQYMHYDTKMNLFRIFNRALESSDISTLKDEINNLVEKNNIDGILHISLPYSLDGYIKVLNENNQELEFCLLKQYNIPLENNDDFGNELYIRVTDIPNPKVSSNYIYQKEYVYTKHWCNRDYPFYKIFTKSNFVSKYFTIDNYYSKLANVDYKLVNLYDFYMHNHNDYVYLTIPKYNNTQLFNTKTALINKVCKYKIKIISDINNNNNNPETFFDFYTYGEDIGNKSIEMPTDFNILKYICLVDGNSEFNILKFNYEINDYKNIILNGSVQFNRLGAKYKLITGIINKYQTQFSEDTVYIFKNGEYTTWSNVFDNNDSTYNSYYHSTNYATFYPNLLLGFNKVAYGIWCSDNEYYNLTIYNNYNSYYRRDRTPYRSFREYDIIMKKDNEGFFNIKFNAEAHDTYYLYYFKFFIDNTVFYLYSYLRNPYINLQNNKAFNINEQEVNNKQIDSKGYFSILSTSPYNILSVCIYNGNISSYNPLDKLYDMWYLNHQPLDTKYISYNYIDSFEVNVNNNKILKTNRSVNIKTPCYLIKPDDNYNIKTFFVEANNFEKAIGCYSDNSILTTTEPDKFRLYVSNHSNRNGWKDVFTYNEKLKELIENGYGISSNQISFIPETHIGELELPADTPITTSPTNLIHIHHTAYGKARDYDADRKHLYEFHQDSENEYQYFFIYNFDRSQRMFSFTAFTHIHPFAYEQHYNYYAVNSYDVDKNVNNINTSSTIGTDAIYEDSEIYPYINMEYNILFTTNNIQVNKVDKFGLFDIYLYEWNNNFGREDMNNYYAHEKLRDHLHYDSEPRPKFKFLCNPFALSSICAYEIQSSDSRGYIYLSGHNLGSTDNTRCHAPYYLDTWVDIDNWRYDQYFSLTKYYAYIKIYPLIKIKNNNTGEEKIYAIYKTNGKPHEIDLSVITNDNVDKVLQHYYYNILTYDIFNPLLDVFTDDFYTFEYGFIIRAYNMNMHCIDFRGMSIQPVFNDETLYKDVNWCYINTKTEITSEDKDELLSDYTHNKIKIYNPNNFTVSNYSFRINIEKCNVLSFSNDVIAQINGTNIPTLYEYEDECVGSDKTKWNKKYLWINIPQILAHETIEIDLVDDTNSYNVTDIFSFYDEFTTSIDTSKWNVSQPSNPTVENNNLVFKENTSSTDKIGILSIDNFSFTGGDAVVEFKIQITPFVLNTNFEFGYGNIGGFNDNLKNQDCLAFELECNKNKKTFEIYNNTNLEKTLEGNDTSSTFVIFSINPTSNKVRIKSRECNETNYWEIEEYDSHELDITHSYDNAKIAFLCDCDLNSSVKLTWVRVRNVIDKELIQLDEEDVWVIMERTLGSWYWFEKTANPTPSKTYIDNLINLSIMDKIKNSMFVAPEDYKVAYRLFPDSMRFNKGNGNATYKALIRARGH